MKFSTSLAMTASFVALGATLLPQSVSAQVNEGFDDDVVVTTAQRRAESLQDVPVAVTVIDTEELETRNIQSTLDIQTLVPNLNLGTNTGTANAARIFLRGIGEDESRGAVEPAVGTYIDGVYIGRLVGSLFDLVDLEQVEVLRGPQGTLYGRNSNGGAIKITSVKPQDNFEASARFTYGNLNRLDGRAMVNVPIGDTTAVRVSGLYKSRDGYFDINTNGAAAAGRRDDVGDLQTSAIRAQLSQDIGNWNLLVTGDYTKDLSDPIPSSVLPGLDADDDIFTVEPTPGTSCLTGNPRAPAGPFQFTRPVGCFAGFENETISQGISGVLSGTLGGYDIKGLTSFRRLDDELSTTIGFPFFQETDQEQFAHELTVSSNYQGPFNFVAGAFAYAEDLNLDSAFVFPFRVTSDTKSWAVFGQGEYEIGDRATFTGGLRYTSEDREFAGINFASEDGSGAFTNSADQDTEKLSYSAKLDYDITEDILVYGSYATGFKGAGFSPDCFGPTACFLPVDEEEVATIEFGVRTDLFDNRLIFNATYFNNDYDDLQIAATVPGLGFTRFNVDETDIQGVELEWRFIPNDYFELNGNMGFLDGEYSSVTELQAQSLLGTFGAANCPGGVATVDCAQDLELKNAPDFKATVGAVFRYPVGNGEMTASGDISFEDESFNLVANAPVNAQSDIPTLINARLAYAPDNGYWNIAAWARNLTDEEYFRAATATGLAVYAAEPATYGVTVGFNFD